MMNNNILIITRDFPPNTPQVGWMIRMTELANYLISQNYNVHVLTCRRRKQWENLLKVDNKIHITRTKGFSTYRDLPLNDCNFFDLASKSLKRIVLHLFNNQIIDFAHLELKQYIAEAKRIIENNNIENIIVSTPPYSLGLVGESLKNQFGDTINLILDYRDAWTLRESFINSKPHRSLSKFVQIEKRILEKADHTLFVSVGMMNDYFKHFEINNPLVVENGFIEYSDLRSDSDFLKKIQNLREENHLIIGYFGSGSLNGQMVHKDVSNLILNINSWTDASKIAIILQGNVVGFDHFKENISINLRLINFPAVSNRSARSNMQYVDICLFYLNDVNEAPHVMGGKLYDYVASGKPIWLVIPNQATSLLEFSQKHRKVFTSDVTNIDSIKETFSRIFSLWKENQLNKYGFKYKEAKEYTRENQYQKILPLLK